MDAKIQSNKQLHAVIGTWEVMVAGVALVVASSTLVSEFTGYFNLGAAFCMALLLGFVINMLLALSAADLSVAYPRAGALYDYARGVLGGPFGEFTGVFLGLAFFGVFMFAASGETAAGAYGLQALTGLDLHINYFIMACSILAVIPNIFGLKTTAWVSAGLLLLMLGIRWFFGLAGFLGISHTGAWSAANLDAGVGLWDWFGDNGILASGLAMAFWSFVGIEFACSLAEEVRHPRTSMTRGMIFGLAAILVTSWIMGLGVAGTRPVEEWLRVANSAVGSGGDAPQLAVGQMMFGRWGYLLMAVASVSATIGTMTVAYAAMPRILYSIARGGRFFGPLSRPFARLHPRYNTPIPAIVFTFVIYQIPALLSSRVIDWIYSAAYAWIILYGAFHLLAIGNRILRPEKAKAFNGGWFLPAAVLGVVATGICLYYAFAGSHLQYGPRALIVLLVALAATGLSFRLPTTIPWTARKMVKQEVPVTNRNALRGMTDFASGTGG